MTDEYIVDAEELIHTDRNCARFEGAPLGRIQRRGVLVGLVNEGEGICPTCLSAAERASLFQDAAGVVTEGGR